MTTSVTIATPVHDATNTTPYTTSLFALGYALGQQGIHTAYCAAAGNSVVQARNFAAAAFLNHSHSHLFFIDSDISFNPIDVLTLLKLSTENPDYGMMCGPYLKKKFPKEYVFSHLENFEPTKPAPVGLAGCGFMLVRRDVFERFREYHGNPKGMSYFEQPSPEFREGRYVYRYFQDEVMDENYVTEDYWFCYKVRQMGVQIWMCPWVKLTHNGMSGWEGDLVGDATLGAAA